MGGGREQNVAGQIAGRQRIIVAPGWNCQTPFKFSQFVRTICGRGLLGSTCAAQSVINGACFICHAWTRIVGKRMAESIAASVARNKKRD